MNSTDQAAASQQKKINVKDIIEKYAMDFFTMTATKKEKKLLAKNYVELTIDWKRVIVTKEPPVYDPEPSNRGVPSTNVLFRTSFTNKTGSKQRYSFRAERVTHSSCTVTLERAITTGAEMNFMLKTPCEIFEANAGFKRELTVTTGDSETIDEELSWGVDSEVEIEPKHVGEAKLTVLEEKYDGQFTLVTRIGGMARVIFTNRKDNNSFIKATDVPVIEAVRQFKNNMKGDKTLPTESLDIDNQRRQVVCTTVGKCNFKYGVQQMVEVDQKPIDGLLK